MEFDMKWIDYYIDEWDLYMDECFYPIYKKIIIDISVEKKIH